MIGTQQELPFSKLHSSIRLTALSFPPLFLSFLHNLSYHTSFLLFLLSNIISFTAFTSFPPLALLHFSLQKSVIFRALDLNGLLTAPIKALHILY